MPSSFSAPRVFISPSADRNAAELTTDWSFIVHLLGVQLHRRDTSQHGCKSFVVRHAGAMWWLDRTARAVPVLGMVVHDADGPESQVQQAKRTRARQAPRKSIRRTCVFRFHGYAHGNSANRMVGRRQRERSGEDHKW